MNRDTGSIGIDRRSARNQGTDTYRVYLAGLLESMSQMLHIEDIPFDKPIARRWKANLTAVSEPASIVRTLSTSRSTWYRSKQWDPQDIGRPKTRKARAR
jgi:hypothetical protein